MTVDREQWAERIEHLPHWRCPTCDKGHLIPILNSLVYKETGPSLAARDHGAWEPDWIDSRFAGFLQCNMPSCKEIAAISGTTHTNHYEQFDHIGGGEQWTEIAHEVKSIDPAPLPIQLPAAIPDLVKQAITSAAGLIWASAEASGNQLRQSVELLMDDVGIATTSTSGKLLDLHKRIVAFQVQDKENGDVLLAIKWLGNSGSHPGGLTRDNVLDAFDMIEYVLENRYSTAKQTLLTKVAAVNAQKGPIKKGPEA